MPRRANGDNQARILEFIKSQIELKGYPPSVREICDAVGLKSTSTVHGHLNRLERKGLLRRDSTKPRAIEILDETSPRKRTVNIPLLGNVTAGQPILAVENHDEAMPLPLDFVGAGEHFMLNVQGDSMIDAGIFDGDYVLVRQQATALNGEIVVALIDEEATVKRFFKEGGHYRLQPENVLLDPIIVPECTILGRVTGLLRRM